MRLESEARKNKAERKITSQREMLGDGMVNLPTLPALYIGSEG